jgi:hypothetical protein
MKTGHWLPPTLVVSMPWLPGSLLGICLGPVVLLHHSLMLDLPSIEHELVHSRQFWRNGLVLHFLRYWLQPSYRQAMEIEAFSAELGNRPQNEYQNCLEMAASSLSSRYGLNLDVATAKKVLDERTREVLIASQTLASVANQPKAS